MHQRDHENNDHNHEVDDHNYEIDDHDDDEDDKNQYCFDNFTSSNFIRMFMRLVINSPLPIFFLVL